MTYFLIIMGVISYTIGGVLTARFTRKIMEGYFGKATTKQAHVFPALVWPVTLPFFRYMNREFVASVNKGKDWADKNVRPDLRQDFRREHMTYSGQTRR